MRRKPHSQIGVALLPIGIVIGLLLAAGLNWTRTSDSSVPVEVNPNVVLGSREPVPQELLQLQNTSDAFVYIAESLIPTVVSIQSRRLVSREEMERFHNRDDLRDFFRFRIPKEFRQEGAGSGIIVSKDGYILTNVHVVDKAQSVRVTLSDNREFDARIVGIDPLTEVAVIKIEAENLPVARLGDSDKSRVGEWVLAIGNPMELRSTVTAGIISAKDRRIDILRDSFSVENFIQTDAAINPGNSGGALVNLRGEVIGINTAIATETGYNAGFGFAIPINLARKIMSDLIRKGRVERGFLGVAMLDMDEKKARALGMRRPRGVFIDRIMPGSPADKAGLLVRDVILSIDGQEVNHSNQVQAIVARKNPGERVRLKLLRAGQTRELTVTLGRKENQTVTLASSQKPQGFKDLGLRLETLAAESSEKTRGVLVTEVEKWSPADEAGLQEGDVIIEINNQKVETVEAFRRALARFRTGDVVIVRAIRGGEALHFFVSVVSK